MLIFIPANDPASNSDDAATIGSLDLEFVQAGETKSISLRVGARSTAETYNLFTGDTWISIDRPSGSLSAGECSDTITLTVAPPLNAPTRSYASEVLSDSGSGTTLLVTYQSVGVNDARRSEYPERRTDFTDTMSDVVNRFSEPLKVYRYDPIAYDPNDRRILLTNRIRKLAVGGNHDFKSQGNPCNRLDPTNATWGYVRSESIILASFQSENSSIRVNFTEDNSEMSFNNTASLTVPAEFELQRLWALFAPAKDNMEPARYKRTVFLFQRQGDVWMINNLYHRFRGNESSHYECDAIQIHDKAFGSPDFLNPFSWVWEFESDKPYAMFHCPLPDLFAEQAEDASASGGSNPSSLNPSVPSNLGTMQLSITPNGVPMTLLWQDMGDDDPYFPDGFRVVAIAPVLESAIGT